MKRICPRCNNELSTNCYVKDKGKYCKDNNINIMIEDDPINLRKLLSNTNILVFDYPYNRNKEFSNLTRVYSWYDTYYRIK